MSRRQGWSLVACLGVGAAPLPALATETAPVGIWTTAEELAVHPMSGAAWEAMLETANQPTGTPNIAANDDDADVRVMAKALVYARTGIASYRFDVIVACVQAIGTEAGGTALALSRNLIGYVIAADLVNLPPAARDAFTTWLEFVRDEDLQGRTLRSTHNDRPNNWGTHAGASRAAVALYLGDQLDLEATATVFKGWLGDNEAYSGFEYGHLWWQGDAFGPVGINRIGSTLEGFPVGGVLADDQRRGGPFTWPPPHVNYVYEALQGVVALAVILDRQGYDVWNWEDQAILRAFEWLHEQANYPASGDDTWQPHVINYFYGACFPAPVPTTPGKNVGYTDWTHAVCIGDLNGDGQVGTADLLVMLGTWGVETVCSADLDGSGDVSTGDLLALLGMWGACP